MSNKDKKGDDNMSATYVEFINNNRVKLWDIARKQTKINSKGQTVISRDDDDFDDDVWDEIYKDNK